MPISEQTYRMVVMEDPDGQWELFDGQLREKPPMSIGHNRAEMSLVGQLWSQLDHSRFELRHDQARVRRSAANYFVPDVYVVPRHPADVSPTTLEIFTEPLPLVVEVWSPSTGLYDVDAKLPEYMKRGDLEIWRLHPFERTLTFWRRQMDGSYVESLLRGGIIQPMALPDVSIDLDALFE